MSDSFVDLGYRGLPLGRRVKLTQVRPSTGYLEVPQPMPVGTAIAITTDDGVAFDATIAEVHEQVAGAERAPGMLVRPALDAAPARTWWEARVQLPELPPPAAPPPVAPAAVVLPKRMTLQGPAAVPELIDDGRNTAVMEAVVVDDGVKPPVVDDGLKTTVMDAVPEEIVAAAEAAAAAEDDPGASGELPAEPAAGDKPEPKGVKRRKKKR